MSASHDNLEALLEQALTFSPEERAAFMAGACGNDDKLRQRLEVLLAAHEAAGDFLPTEPGIIAEAPAARPTISVAPVTEQPGNVIGRYKLLEKVGEGGFGVVYVAEQREPVKRRVALKIIKLGMDTRQVIARFEAERQALAMMDHPNISKVLDAGATETGRPYFVMELVRGIKITDYCDQHNLSTRERLDLFVKVCQAIQHAHQKGIIHRDIKPSNILVTVNDGVPVPKVIDFGIAKATQGELTEQTVYTQLQQFIGTPAYMSPEQAEMTSLDIDTRSDIYSLGVLLYELLTGKTPFDPQQLLQSGLDEMRRTIREKEPPRPSTRLSTMLGAELSTTARHQRTEAPKLVHLLRGDLDWIVMKCLEKDRTRRYETANGLAADLQRHLSNEPVVARPPSRLYQFQKLARRNRLGFAAATAVLVALLLGIAGSTWQAVRATVAEREQRRLRERAEASERREAKLRHQAELHEKAARAASFFARGTSAARIGQWRSAATDFKRAIDLDPTDHEFYHWLTPLLIQAGDLDAYREHCQKTVARFGGTSDPLIAERMAKGCLILSASWATSDVVEQWIDTAVHATNENTHSGWFQLVKGLAEYRLNRFDSAVEWTRLALLQPDPHRDVQAQVILAMARLRLGQREQAENTLDEARALQSRLPQVENGGPGVMWLDCIFNRVILQEAQTLIEGSIPVNPSGINSAP